jgi:hypothetical protein
MICFFCKKDLSSGFHIYKCIKKDHEFIYSGMSKCWYLYSSIDDFRIGCKFKSISESIHSYYIIPNYSSYLFSYTPCNFEIDPFHMDDALEIGRKFIERFNTLKVFI